MADRVWTIKDILDWTRNDLEHNGDEHPRLSAEWLLSAATGKSRVELYLNFDQPLTPAELKAMREGVVRRRAGEPLQYVTGEVPFRHIILRCERGVLIPRPETEILVDAALEGVDAAAKRRALLPETEMATEEGESLEPQDVLEARDPVQKLASLPTSSLSDGDVEYVPIQTEGVLQASETESFSEEDADAPDVSKNDELDIEKVSPLKVRVADLCCGTGCIGLSIASEREDTVVWEGDLSEQAVSLTERNRDALNLTSRVVAAQGDLYEALPGELAGTLDVIVSNPPYIPSAVVPTLPQEVVGYEPGLALDGGKDGLDLFRRLLEGAPQWLAPEGMLCVELFEDSLDAAAALAQDQKGWAHVEIRPDLTGRPRVLIAVREGER
ncbi:peptide chain release factor N(5)-glutamine methyltransferase [Olsenella sp. KGMB02461]|nr:peptide chain release factor N(5)-glutamine methyltransferase [Olsenella sp. KGMB02461]